MATELHSLHAKEDLLAEFCWTGPDGGSGPAILVGGRRDPPHLCFQLVVCLSESLVRLIVVKAS